MRRGTVMGILVLLAAPLVAATAVADEAARLENLRGYYHALANFQARAAALFATVERAEALEIRLPERRMSLKTFWAAQGFVFESRAMEVVGFEEGQPDQGFVVVEERLRLVRDGVSFEGVHHYVAIVYFEGDLVERFGPTRYLDEIEVRPLAGPE